MKILLLSTHHDIFAKKIGAHHRIYNIAKQLDNNNNHLIILQPDRFIKESPEFECEYFREHSFSLLESIGWKYLPLMSDFNLNLILKMRNLLKNQDVDLIQIEYPWGIIATKILLKLMKKNNISLIYDSHDVEYRLIKQFRDNFISKKSQILKYLFLPGLFYIYLQERGSVKNLGVNCRKPFSDTEFLF